jgi:beta-glucosidase
MTNNSFLQFPPGFLWGAATSAYQIEGSWNEEGRGASIWDTFSHTPGKTYAGHHGDVAAGHYQHWKDDVGLIAELGLQTYRFSIAWPRILPLGSGAINPAGLDFYDRLVDELLAHGVQPFVTLYHWDLPQALQDTGGWVNRQTASLFAEYAHIVAARLGDRVKYWVTHNEPLVMAMSGHLLGDHAPGIQDPFTALQVGNHLLLSHGLAVEALRAGLPGEAQIGITLNLNPFYPATESREDRLAAGRAEALMNGLFLEPLFHGRMPQELYDLFGPMLPMPSAEDLNKICVPLDFLGINYYSRVVVRHDAGMMLGQASQVHPEGSEYSQMWEIYPPGLSELLLNTWNCYHPPQIFITENGIPVPDGLDFDGRVRDYRRIHYLREHIIQVHQAIQAGVLVKGYLVWSLLDNFEWAYGYQMRFGLVYVNFETLQRTIKESGRWYAGVIRANGLDPDGQAPGH